MHSGGIVRTFKENTNNISKLKMPGRRLKGHRRYRCLTGFLLFACAVLPIHADPSATNLFPQLQSPSAQSLGGNWAVSLTDKDGTVLESTHIVLAPPSKSICVKTSQGHCFYHDVDNPEGDWAAYYLGSGNIYKREFKINSDSNFEFGHAYGMIGHWGANSVINISGDTGHGQWSYGESAGPEHWQRLRPKINQVGFGKTLAGTETFEPNSREPQHIVEYGAMGRVKGKYDSWWWAANRTSPANRPKFYITLFGENLWGHHVIDFENSPGFLAQGCSDLYDENSGQFLNHVGLRCEVSVMNGTTNGIKTFRFDNLKASFIFDVSGLPQPPPPKPTINIEAFNSEGQTETVTGGYPFRISVSYDEMPSASPSAVEILDTAGGRPLRFVSLRPSRDQKVFTSQWFYPLFETPEELREGETLEPTTPELQTRLANDYSGDWMLASASPRGGHGVATIGRGGDLRLSMARSNETKHYLSVATAAYRSVNDPTEIGRYVAYMKLAQGENVRRQPAASGELLILPLAEKLTLRLGNTEKTIDVETLSILDGMFVDVAPTEEGSLSGTARIFSADTENIELTRDTRYVGAVVLDDQWPSTEQTGQTLREMSYPFGPRLTVGASRYRNILVFGENLPGFGFVTSSDEKLEHYYATAAAPGQVVSTLEGLEIDHPSDFNGLVVQTLLKPGVEPGRKTLRINGVSLPWDLQFADSLARYIVLREPEPNVFEPANSLYEGDLFRVAVKALGGLPLPQSTTAKLEHYRIIDGRQQLVGQTEISLTQKTIGEETMLVSTPITFHPLSTYEEQGPVRPGHFVVTVEDRFVISGAVGGLRVVPPKAVHEIDRYNPFESIWDKAVETAKTCPDSRRKTSHWILTNVFSSQGVTQTIDSSVEDHAAAILLANETYKALVEHKETLLPIRNENGVKAIMELGRQHRGPFWSVLKADVEGVGTEPLFELLRSPQSLVRRWSGDLPGITPEKAETLAQDTVKRVFNHHLEQMNDALFQLKRVSDCDYNGLLNLVAHRASNAPQRLMPKLVRAEGQFNLSVIPDRAARSTVQSLYVKGDAIKALQQWSSTDSAVVAAFASIATFGAGELLTLGGYATAAAILGGGDAIVGLGMGINGAAAHYQATRFSDYAEGARSVLGEQTLAEAIRAEPNIFMTAAGIILPAVSAKQALNSMRATANLPRGARLAKKLKDFSPEELARLSEADAIHVAAYIASVEHKLAKQGRFALSTDEQIIHNLVRRATGNAPKVPTRATAPVDTVGELSANMTREEFDALNQSGITLTTEQLQRKIDAILSGRFTTRAPNAEPAINVTEVAGEAGQPTRVRLEAPSLPDAVDPNKTLILDLELPSPGPDYGHRLMDLDELTDFATNPRVRITPDAARLQQRNDVYVPWDEIEGVETIDGVVRRSRWHAMDEAPRLRLDAEVRQMVDEAAAIGNPWAKRLQSDMRNGTYDYFYDPALPDHYGGVGIRANDEAGHGALGALNPFELSPNGNYILRTPEAISRDLIHEYAHTWRGGQPLIDELRGPAGAGVLRGEYNEVRAFIAESRFQRDVGIARQLNGRPYLAPGDGIVSEAAAMLPANSPGLSGGTRLRNQTALLLRGHPEYLTIYQTAAERFLGLSPRSGGSTIALQQRINALDDFLAGPQFSQLPDATRQVWREQMLQQMLDESLVP